jgi:hypothetical protein
MIHHLLFLVVNMNPHLMRTSTTPRLAFHDLQLVAKSAFTDLRSVGKGFTDPPLFTNCPWVVHFKFY